MEVLNKILNIQNMIDAMEKVLTNKGAGGIDKITVEQFREKYDNGEISFNVIQNQIKERKYKPNPVKRVYIPKDNGDKRGLGIPTIMDRIIQQSIVQVLEPIFEEHFSNNSYGFRPGRSCEMAIIKLLEYFNDEYTWIVDIDLEKFFDNVCHDKLCRLVDNVVKDGDVVSLIRKYLVAGVMENGVVSPTKVGTPQGGNLSPLLSNIMLNELDKELEKRGLNFVRYADDCIIVVKSEKAANRVMKSITNFIEKKLGLKVNAEKSKVARPHEIKYLGFGFYYKNGKIRPKPHLKSVQKFKRKLKEITKRSNGLSIDEKVKRLNQTTRGWVNYFKIADMKSLMTEISHWIRRRLRMCIWKYWKLPQTKYKALIKLGISQQDAYEVANTRKGYYWEAMTPVIHIALSNDRLKRKGLVFSLDHYLKVHTII